MDLFSDAISDIPTQNSPLLSKAQKAFNALIGKIGKKRTLQADWESVVPRFQQHYLSELLPLIEQAAGKRRELAHRLDWAYRQKNLGKTERRSIANLICELTGALASENDDDEMKALYNKYSGSDFDQEEAASIAGMKAMLEDTLGFDIGEDMDMRSPEAFMQQVQARLVEEAEKIDAARRTGSESRAQRKQTAKQIAKEEKLREEAQRVSLSLREIYRKLASALHPDREPDPGERARKTALMQSVNQAYEKKDLLRLLELQLEIEHIDQAAINTLSEERLTHYNKILKEQLGELENEIIHIDHEFRMRFGFDPYSRLDPASLMRLLDADIAQARMELRAVENDLNAAQAIGTLKAWLKQVRRRQREYAYDDDMPF
ncbi:MAG: J domain-containing protein [Sulfuriferula multivorans]|uniref:J domain-containing protein n=1 Tax=Sulfuriferula multivorans TaxID=1559896 RepID=A0A7C9P8Z3_9PROT|nr:J domain-containing protein [Sulfuriferula multivorans]